MKPFVETHDKDLEAFAAMSQKTGARADYVQGGGGNTSVKLEGGLMAIKASGFKLGDITRDKAYAVLNYQSLREFYGSHELSEFDDVEKSGSAVAKQAILTIEGLDALRPSVEAGFHAMLQKFVNHTHSVYANLATCCKQGREIAEKALADAAYSYGFVPYTDPGAKLTFIIRDEVRRVEKATGRKPSVIFMQNHGVIATDDDMGRCLAIHEDVNARIAKAFGKKLGDFPPVSLRDNADGTFSSNTPYLKEKLQNSRYDTAFFTEDCLYPDQIVFLKDTAEVIDSAKGQTSAAECVIDTATGDVTYRMGKGKAMTIEETLTAIMFIVLTIKENKKELSTLGEAAQAFIAGWESEKYRKTLAK